jgi:hypothetical protein
VFRIALFVVLAVAAAGLAARAMTRIQPWGSVGDAAILLLIPAALIVASLIRQPVVFTADAQPSMSCTEQHGIRYCVHTENRARLPELARSIDPVIARFGTKPANVDQVWDQSLTARPARGVELAWLEPDGTIQSDVAATAAGVYACAFAEPEPESELEPDSRQSEQRTQVAIDVSDYLMTGTPTGTLSAMSALDVRRWLVAHQDQLHACTLDQLPR